MDNTGRSEPLQPDLGSVEHASRSGLRQGWQQCGAGVIGYGDDRASTHVGRPGHLPDGVRAGGPAGAVGFDAGLAQCNGSESGDGCNSIPLT